MPIVGRGLQFLWRHREVAWSYHLRLPGQQRRGCGKARQSDQCLAAVEFMKADFFLHGIITLEESSIAYAKHASQISWPLRIAQPLYADYILYSAGSAEC